ncbi:MAG: histone deacetylase [Chitinophagaceae bacterium]|nr:histone deacetylase [Chitinophagaceae bacterium]
MLKIAYDPIYSHPLPEGHRFPMVKYELIPEQLLYQGLITRENLFSPSPLEEEWIVKAHSADYWRRLKTLELTPKEMRVIGFPLSAALIEREIRIARGTIDCALYALDYGVALNVAGGTHHAFHDRGEGFCILNDIAIAANYLLASAKSKRILIVDLDVHQGNGTAALFYGEERVFTFSMHGEHNYPFRKEKSDLDIGLPDGTNGGTYLSLLEKQLPVLLAQQRPDFVFYLSGVDVLSTDKYGKLLLSQAECQQRDAFVLNTCQKKGLPVAISMGGGYSPDIRNIVDAHCNTFRAAADIYGW